MSLGIVWSNDDDDNPGLNFLADYLNSVVDGVDDLPDLFPVFLDIKQLMTVLPPGASVKYKLKQADGALNLVYTNLTRATAFSYQTGTLTTGFGPSFAQPAATATTQQITAAGIELPAAFLTNIKDNDQGVILVEMRAMTAAPLKLVVEKDNVQIAEVAVDIATGEIDWVSQHTANPVEEFKVPAAYADYTTKPLQWLEGQRYFVDGASAAAQAFRIRINVKVRMAGAAGRTVELKAFDVDDPTPSNWDPDNVVDTNVLAGDDNRSGGVYPGDNGSIHEGTFSSAFLKTTTVTLDANGEATAEFILSQKPGNNYRVAGVLNESASQIDGLQITNASAPRYVAPNSKPVPGFAGVISPTLTIWRKLHVELDSMNAISTNPENAQKNYITGTIVSAQITAPFATINLADEIDDVPRFDNQGDCTIEIAGRGVYEIQRIVSPTAVLVRAVNPADFSNLQGVQFTLRDDDYEIVPLSLVSSTDTLLARVSAYYAPAFIEMSKAANPEPSIPFKLNQSDNPLTLPNWASEKDGSSSSFYWHHLVSLGFQSTLDDDIDGEDIGSAGGTPEENAFGMGISVAEYSAIFVENIRELDIGVGARSQTAARQNEILDSIAITIAHELGHAPGDNLASADHAEEGLMKNGGASDTKVPFSALSIKRFRQTNDWHND